MTRERSTILQTGTYNSMNKGDAAMELSTAQSLKRVLKDPRIVVSTPFPKLDRDAYDGCEIAPTTRRRLIWNTLLVGRAYLWRRLKEHGIAIDALARNPEIRSFLDADLVVDLSGDMLTEDYGVHVAYSHYLPLMLALATGKPLAICAQSVGPFKWTRPLIRALLRRAKLITVRDQISWDHLERLGVLGPNAHLTADMAFLLCPVSADRVDAILRQEGIAMGGRPAMRVSLSPLIKQKYGSRNPLARSEPFVRLFAGLLDEVSAELDVDVLFVPHVTGPKENKDDRTVAEQVRGAMQSKAWSLSGDYKPDELKAIISRTSLFFGARMHANIAAISSCVPTVAVAYSHKTRGIMASVGQVERVAEVATLTRATVLHQLRSTWASRRQVRAELEAALPGIKCDSERNVHLLVELLQNQKPERA